MSIVKGVIFKMLLEAYQKRDRVGMIAFRKKKAEVLLPITRSVEFAQKKLADLPTGGKTLWQAVSGKRRTCSICFTVRNQLRNRLSFL